MKNCNNYSLVSGNHFVENFHKILHAANIDRFSKYLKRSSIFFFAELVLRQEQEEYKREGIEWTNIEYFNNQASISWLYFVLFNCY